MLANEERPSKFKDVIGQKTTIKAVTNYLKNNKYPQSSIFLGASGNGKSTIARLVAKTLNCKNPKVEDGIIEPCCECASCKDIENERYQLGVSSYEGVNLTIDKIRELEESLKYGPSLGAKNNVIVIEEAQTVPTVAFKSFLTLIEKQYKNTYFILTSTDVSKFSGSSWASDNKTQEQVALKSRLATFKIKPTSTSEIEEHLFKILCKIDPDEKLPTTIEELISYIAQNSHGNIRDAINSFDMAIEGGIYTKEECIELFGGEDITKEYDVVYQLATKNIDALKYIELSYDKHGNFIYWNKIVGDSALHSMINIPYKEQWKEESSQKIIKSGNLKSLLECFAKTSSECGSYWNDSIFVKNLYLYYNESKSETISTPIVKKVMKVKKVE